MSFILKDKNLINELLKLAQVPGTPPVVPQANDNVKAIARKLVNNLSNQSVSSNEFTADKDDANLHMQLANLKDLLNFLNINGIRQGNNKLVIPHARKGGGMQAGASGDAEFTQLDPTTKILYVQYPEPDDSGDNFDYYINKNGLLSYLADLKQQSIAADGPRERMMRPLVANLIKEVENIGWKMPIAQTNINKSNTTNVGTQNKDNQYQNAGYKTTSNVDQNGNLTPQGITVMTSVELPLMPEDIDLDRIERFFFKYVEVTKDDVMASYITSPLTAIKQNYPGIRTIMLNSNYEELDNQAKNTTNGKENAGPLLGLLFQVLQGTEQMLNRLNGILRRSSSLGQDVFQQKIQLQVTSMYNRNIQALNKFQSQMKAKIGR